VTYSPDSIYDQGDSISTFGANHSAAPTGPLRLPDVDFSGYCNDWSLGLFEHGTAAVAQLGGRSLWQYGVGASQVCVRAFSGDVTVFAAQCEFQQSLNRYATDLFIAKRSDSASVGGSASLNVSISTVLYQDPLTGVITDVTAEISTCTTKTIATANGYKSSNLCVFGSNSTLSDFKTRISSVNPLCNNVIKSVSYVVENSDDEHATISAASATLVLTDLLMTEPLTQSFSLNFVDSAVTFRINYYF
jgi:hypothetical protein